MRARRPQWTEALLQRKRLKKAGGRPLDSIPTQERERLERRALASAFAVIIQGHEDECLMTAVRVLQGGGWIVHSLQQDGVLAEPGRLAGGVPAAPTQGSARKQGGTATETTETKHTQGGARKQGSTTTETTERKGGTRRAARGSRAARRFARALVMSFVQRLSTAAKTCRNKLLPFF